MNEVLPPGIRRSRAVPETLVRIVSYSATRLVALFLTVVVGVYLTILVANMGGYVDVIKRAEIREGAIFRVLADPKMMRLPSDERARRIEEMIRLDEDRLGLNRPFIARSLVYLRDALVLRLGFAERMNSDPGSRLVPNIPLDRAVIALAPTSAAPAWFYGIFLILIFAALLRLLPFGGMIDAPPPPQPAAYVLSVLRHMVLPIAAIVLSSIFIAIYSLRTFFLIFSSEDYVEVAKAKGLSSGTIERRYILRPTLPTILTGFLLGLIGAWTGAIVLETVFNWPGLGRALFQAIGLFDTPVIVGATIIYAYLLAITVFVLDILYAWVDPRVKVGLEGRR